MEPRRQSASECLTEARKLTKLGFPEAACARARLALELALRSKIAVENCWPVDSKGFAIRKPRAQECVDVLHASARISERQKASIFAAHIKMSDVVHGQPIGEGAASHLIRFVHKLAEGRGRPWLEIDLVETNADQLSEPPADEQDGLADAA